MNGETPSPAEGRLAAHVARLLAAAGVPSSERAELAEELTSHLLERVTALRAEGLSETDAVERAIAQFGSAEELSPELSRVYHSGLWASTIGTLLPAAVAATGGRPGVVTWMRIALGVSIAVGMVAVALAVWQMTPLRAIVVVATLLAGLAAEVLAYQALGRGQRWAAWYALGVAALLVAYGIGSVVTAPSGTTTIPLGAVLGAGVLLAAMASWERLSGWFTASRPIGRWLSLGLAGSLILPAVVPPVMSALPDPTQASAKDVRMDVAMTCDRADLTELIGAPAEDIQRIVVAVDMRWERGDVLPGGLWGVMNASNFGDTASFLIPADDPALPLPSWVLLTSQEPVTSTGDVAGWFGSTYPSVELVPDTIGSFTVGVDPIVLSGPRRIRFSWTLSPSQDGDAAWPRVEVSYAHVDRFLLQTTVGCGDTARARPVPFPTTHNSDLFIGP